MSGQALTELSENGDAAVGGLIVGNGNRALHGAAQNGHASIVRSLLEFGADGNAPARNGFTPLFLAARDGKVDAARSLVMNPLVLVDQVTDSGTTSLGIACRRGHPELASLLLAAGAQINAIFHDSSTALLQSCMGKNEAKARECVSVCLEAGADVGHVFNSSQGDYHALSLVRHNGDSALENTIRTHIDRTQQDCQHHCHSARGCRFGAGCLLSHRETRGVIPCPRPPMPVPSAVVPMCHFFQRGRCRAGESCRFSHSPTEER